MHPEILLLCVIGAAICAAVLQGIDVQAASNINVPTSTETLVAIGNPVTLQGTNAKAVIRAWVQLTVGTGTTAVTLTVYAGSAIGGRVVGQQNAQGAGFTPGQNSGFYAEFTDPLSNTGGAQYCLSVKQTGAGGNGTVLSAALDTMVLSG